MLSVQKKGPLSLAKVQAAPYIAANQTSEAGDSDYSGDDDRLPALRRRLQDFGLSVHRMCGSELALSGPGFSRMAPDERCAWLLVRQLQGVA